MNNINVIKLVIFFNLFLPAGLLAEGVVLKSGKKIEGRIVEQTGEYVKIESNGSPLYYERKYIASIEGDNLESADINSYIKSGLQYGSQAKFKEAEEELKEGLKIYPSEHNLKEVSKIIDDLRKGLIREEYVLHWFKGSHNLINAQYQPAITEFKEALKLHPDDPDLYYYLGVCNYSLEQYEEAITDLKKVSGIKPNDEVYYYLGASHYSLGRYPEAIAYMKKVLEINPDDAEAYSIMGTSQYLSGEPKQAREALSKAIGLLKNKGDYLKAADIEEFLGKLN